MEDQFKGSLQLEYQMPTPNEHEDLTIKSKISPRPIAAVKIQYFNDLVFTNLPD